MELLRAEPSVGNLGAVKMVSMVEHLMAVFTLRQLGLNTLREGWVRGLIHFSQKGFIRNSALDRTICPANLHGVLLRL